MQKSTNLHGELDLDQDFQFDKLQILGGLCTVMPLLNNSIKPMLLSKNCRQFADNLPTLPAYMRLSLSYLTQAKMLNPQ
jgi:hypothetical protein